MAPRARELLLNIKKVKVYKRNWCNILIDYTVQQQKINKAVTKFFKGTLIADYEHENHFCQSFLFFQKN